MREWVYGRGIKATQGPPRQDFPGQQQQRGYLASLAIVSVLFAVAAWVVVMGVVSVANNHLATGAVVVAAGLAGLGLLVYASTR